MPKFHDLKAFREKYTAVKVAAEAARRNIGKKNTGITNQSFSVIESDGFRDMSLWTLLRYFWALDCDVAINVTAPDGSAHELDVSPDFDRDHALLLNHIDRLNGKKPTKGGKVSLQADKKRRKGISPVPKSTGPATPRLLAKPDATKVTDVFGALSGAESAALRTLRRAMGGLSVEWLQREGGFKGRRKELREALALLKAKKLAYTMGKRWFPKNAPDWKRPK